MGTGAARDCSEGCNLVPVGIWPVTGHSVKTVQVGGTLLKAVPVQVSALRPSLATSLAAQRHPLETCASRNVAAVRTSPWRPSQPQGSWEMEEAPLCHRMHPCAPSVPSGISKLRAHAPGGGSGWSGRGVAALAVTWSGCVCV